MTDLICELEGILRWPKKRSDKEAVVKWLATKFTPHRKYSEKEVNQIIDQNHAFQDIALLRRELISRKHLMRKKDGSQYWKPDQ
ncbi:MAG: DUF2087 domain-containing protein [Planctomycetota bacterium]|nr:DUF2087 domain-containing protein [Planctomycetota bacterium]